MTHALHYELLISPGDSQSFAQLSGDYNPLHIDPIAARRTQFGSTVVHGIHLFLSTLDKFAQQGLLNGQSPAALTATFASAALTNTVVSVHAETTGSKARVRARQGDVEVFTGSIELGETGDHRTTLPNESYERASPADVDFPPSAAEGRASLRLHRSLLSALFPSLARLTDVAWIADIAATTQVVGMRCPGMHSIYSGFRLRRRHAPAETSSLLYRVSGMEHRLKLLRIHVAGACFEGSIETFFRPRPAQQRSMEAIAGSVPRGIFSGHRALVVGGSRGLGELTTKIVAAGGADVTFTYARGEADAERVGTELRDFGCKPTIQHLDVAPTIACEENHWLTQESFTHVYYFASPRIQSNAGRWSRVLFQQFTDVYVSAFATLAELILDRPPDGSRVCFFYPSSIFVSQPEAGFLEYAAAKGAGEVLCDQLRSPHALFSAPRLPRMLTDQTTSIIDIGAADPFPIMLDAVRTFHT